MPTRATLATLLLAVAASGGGLWEPRESLRFCSPHRVPRNYLGAFDTVVKALRLVRISSRAYVRPPAGAPQPWAGGHAADDLGNKWVRPVGDRLVPLEPGNPWAHVLYAMTHITALPHASHSVQMHAHETLRDIADYMAKAGANLVADGLARRKLMEAAADTLRPFADWVVEHIMTKEASRITSHVNVPLMCAWVEAYDWPDIRVGEHLAFGFPSFGTMPDSGLFRPVCRPAEYTRDALGKGLAAKPPGKDQRGRTAATERHPSNEIWLQDVIRKTKREALAALAEGGEKAMAIRAIEASVLKEARASTTGADGSSSAQPTMSKPMTAKELRAWASAAHDGLRGIRVITAFARAQGERADGSIAWRRIDNAKTGGQNGAVTHCETTFCPCFETPANACRILREACEELGLPMPECGLTVDDMAGAFRQVPNADAHWFVVAFYYTGLEDGGRLGQAGIRFSVVYGHTFGSSASVLNFGRVAHLLSWVARVHFGLLTDHYVDDHFTVDAMLAGTRAADGIGCTHNCAGFKTKPDKHQPLRAKNKLLGVMANLASVHLPDGFASYTATESRIRNILRELQNGRQSGRLEPSTAEEVVGKLSFTLQTAAIRVGRAVVGVLNRHARGTSSTWTLELGEILEFLLVVLPLLPPLLVYMRRDKRRPVYLYTDASYVRKPGKFGPGDGKLGIWLVDLEPPEGQPAMVFSRQDVPRWCYHLFDWDKKQHIAQAEMLAMVSAYYTYGDRLRGRAVMHWCDNTVALSAAVGGSGNFPGCMRLVCMLHLALLWFNILVYFDWVPTDDNPADWPTREDKFHLIPPEAVEEPMRIPPSALFGPLNGDSAVLATWQAALRRRQPEVGQP